MKPWSVKRLFRYITRTRDDVRRDIADEISFHTGLHFWRANAGIAFRW
ncbi:MAG TPA: hypothetical protein VH458_00375 [Vicinamibacterales bacterium]|jgi:hypothetical protein